MKTVLKLLLAAIMLASLNACVVAPAYPGYVQPGATIMVPAPYPYYGPSYYGGFGIEYHRHWRRH
jgi:hypothetical protein